MADPMYMSGQMFRNDMGYQIGGQPMNNGYTPL